MDSKQLLNRVTQQLKQASKDSTIQAGDNGAIAYEPTVEQKEAINQIFELFRFNYHNQFLKAFPDLDTMIMAKRLWAKLLADYSGQVIMRAAEKTVKDSTYLPNVHEVLMRCDIADVHGLPSTHAAYMEACRAPSPKREYSWTHPAIYYAGRASDWFFLANEPEAVAFPVFKRNYELLLQRIQQGEEIELELPKALPEHSSVPLPRKEQQQRLHALQDLLKD